MERGTSRTVTYTGFLLAVLLLAGAVVVTYRSQRLYQQTVAIEARTYVVLEAITEFQNRVLQGESSARGYVLTGNRQQRRDSEHAIEGAVPLFDSLVSLTLDNPEQQRRLVRISPLTARRAALIRELLAARDSAPGVTRRIEAIVYSGDAVMHQLRSELGQFKLEELRLLDARAIATADIEESAMVAAFGGVALALVILLAAVSITFQELRERERAERELHLDAERQAVMIEMQQAIATASSTDTRVLDLIVEQAMELTSAHGAALSLVDGEDQIARTARGTLLAWIGVRIPIAGGIIEGVLRDRQPEIIHDIKADPRADAEMAERTGTRSAVILPLLSGDTAVGTLIVTSSRTRAFTPQDFTALKIMSGILSAGITNAAAFEANERLLAELRRSRDAAEGANRAKSAFLATMSHELRTPLNSVIGFANILLRNRAANLGEQDLQFLGRIKENGVHLLDLINDILDVSKIEAGRLELQPIPTDLTPLVRETVAQLAGTLTGRPVELKVSAPDGLLPVEVDPGRFKQVLINLIANALKFTEQGVVKVEIVAELGGRPVRIDITDTGVGIPPDRLEAIFEAFTQAEGSTERRFGGTGLGLTISRSLLHLMGADLVVQSTLGQGSTFSITFPASAARVAADQRRLQVPVSLPPPGAAPLILIVDDEAEARTLLRSYLEDDGYRTIEAADGLEGLAQARALHPALITLDIRMPGMNGVEFLRQLRADPAIAGIPVLVISIEAAEHRGALVGAVDVLAKPVERDGLLGVVQRILPTGQRRILVVDDDVHTRQLFAAVLGAEGYLVRTARDGLEAFTAIDSEPPDLIILDLMMPVMSGGTFLAALRRNPRYSSLPVAVVTALDMDSEAVRRLDGAAHAVVQKGPALEQTLREVLHSLLGGPA